MSSTPLGMRPPSFWNFCGSRRKSMISCSSSLASSTPATSLNVTFFCALDDSFALLLPNESALFPPLCIWRMMNTQKPIISRIGTQVESSAVHGLAVGSRAVTTTLRSSSRLASPSYCGGATVRNCRRLACVPEISLPVMVTEAIWPVSTAIMNSVKVSALAAGWNLVEKFQTMTAMTAIAIQNTKLRIVEFKSALPSDFPTAKIPGFTRVSLRRPRPAIDQRESLSKTIFPRRSSTRAPGTSTPAAFARLGIGALLLDVLAFTPITNARATRPNASSRSCSRASARPRSS